MEAQKCLLSVIVPVYNGANYVPKLIDSILENNDLEKQGIEIILIDDGSKDDSKAVCQKICSAHQNIAYARKENGGIASARNYGLSLAKGEYVTFADQDDRILAVEGGYSHFLQQCLREDLDILYTSPYHMNENGTEPRQRIFEDRLIEDEALIRGIAGKLIDGKYLSNEQAPFISTSVWNVLYRRKMIDEHRIAFKVFIDYEDDWIFNIESLIVAKRIALSSEGYYCWMIHSSSESHRSKYIPDLLKKRKRWMEWLAGIVKALCVSEERVSNFIEHVLRPRNIMMCFNNACWKPQADKKEILAEISKAIGPDGWDISTVSFSKVDGMDRKNKVLLALLKLGCVNAAYELNRWILKRRFH